MFSTEIVCADSIHKNNAYRLNKLMILLVPDEFGKGTGVMHPKCLLPPLIYCTSLHSGHPIAWCISDCENNVALQKHYYKAIKVKVVMADNGMYVPVIQFEDDPELLAVEFLLFSLYMIIEQLQFL